MGKATAATRMAGTIKRIVSGKGFGFIAGEDDRQEFFFHLSSCEGVEFSQLSEGQRVTFEPTAGAKGPRAERVTPDEGTGIF